jgi:ABC-type Na+ transport system ATPase subunit NatA
MSTVGIQQVDIATAKRFVKEEIGVEFRERGYFERASAQ